MSYLSVESDGTTVEELLYIYCSRTNEEHSPDKDLHFC